MVIVIFSLLPVYDSVAVTLRILLTSISKQTEIYGTPLFAGGIPSKLNLPSKWLSLVSYHSPS